jgi:hypothetical protein
VGFFGKKISFFDKRKHFEFLLCEDLELPLVTLNVGNTRGGVTGNRERGGSLQLSSQLDALQFYPWASRGLIASIFRVERKKTVDQLMKKLSNALTYEVSV